MEDYARTQTIHSSDTAQRGGDIKPLLMNGNDDLLKPRSNYFK
jgi:hypothetical protein